MGPRLARAEVPVEQTWNLEDLFPTYEAWQAAVKAIESDIATVTAYKGRLAEGADTLADCIEAMEQTELRFIRVYSYAFLRMAADGSDPACQADHARAGALAAKLEAEIAFFRSELLSLPDGAVERRLAQEPRLGSLRRFLEQMMADKPYMLSPETEEALAALGEVFAAPQNIYEHAKSSDMAFNPVLDSEGHEVHVSFATYEVKHETSSDTVLRRNAYASFSRGLAAYKNTFGATFGAEVKKNVVMARLRGFESATHMLLHEHEGSIDVYNNLLNMVNAGLRPYMRRYAHLRKSVLGLDKLLYCDIEAPLDPGYSPAVSYDEGSRLIEQSVEMMGAEYVEIIRTALAERWIDRVDNVGKSTGAFCAPLYDVHPYILTTWADDMNSAFTVAHELGHAAHGVLTARNQRPANSRSSRFFVEAPSTISELLLAQLILGSASDSRKRRWVLMQLLGTYYHNYVRHLLEGELLRRVYAMAEEDTPITEAVLSKTKGDILEEYWGDEVEIDDGARLTWMRQPHYYMGLYPYTYSAGLTCATAVAKDIRDQGKPAAARWVEVLKAGGSAKPLELMAMAGVDLSTPDPIHKAIAYVGNIVEELERSF